MQRVQVQEEPVRDPGPPRVVHGDTEAQEQREAEGLYDPLLTAAAGKKANSRRGLVHDVGAFRDTISTRLRWISPIPLLWQATR
jgi:hypothetical protein